uniref:PDGFA associated protein 1 n=3 Tax=Colubroidea TaxID=34989 RepID=A0A8C5WNB1_LATLA
TWDRHRQRRAPGGSTVGFSGGPFWFDGGATYGFCGGLFCSSASLELPSPRRDVTRRPVPPWHRRRFPGGFFLVEPSDRPSTKVACLALRRNSGEPPPKRNPRTNLPLLRRGQVFFTRCLYLPALKLSPFPSGGRRDNLRAGITERRRPGTLNGRRHPRRRSTSVSGSLPARGEARRVGGGGGRRSRTTRSPSEPPSLPDLAMPKGGKKGGHKGRARQYTSPEEIDAQLQAEKQKAREEEEEQEEGGSGASGEPKKKEKSLDSDESEEEEGEDYQPKHKGVEGMIDIENPNRAVQTAKKVTQLDLESPRELSRREREEIEKQKAKERYMKMHLAGKTEQAKADLARLAIIRKQREEAAKKKEEERRAKDEAAMAGKRMQSLSLNK